MGRGSPRVSEETTHGRRTLAGNGPPGPFEVEMIPTARPRSASVNQAAGTVTGVPTGRRGLVTPPVLEVKLGWTLWAAGSTRRYRSTADGPGIASGAVARRSKRATSPNSGSDSTIVPLRFAVVSLR